MEGLFAVIFIIIGVVNFVMKQQQEQNKRQGGMKRPQSGNGQYPGQQRSYKVEQPKKPVAEMQEFWSEGLKGILESEGVEAEDRTRTGSLNYTEQSQSLEGVCDEHPEHEQRKKKEKVKKTTSRTEPMEVEVEGSVFEITEDNLLSSIIMAEVLGPPRSMKRSIR